MNKTNRTMKTIFTQKLAGYLMLKGFVLVDIEPNEDNSGRNVFYFNDSQQLESAMEQYHSKYAVK